MGLLERRALEEFQKSVFPKLKSDIDASAGFPVSMEVKWETLAADGYAHLYNEAFPKIYFEPLVLAFKKIAVDQMGKDALKAGLKMVLIANTKGAFSPNGFSFEEGVLNLDHEPCSNIDDVNQRAEGIQKLLESKL
jgi:hypothetical protein